MNRSRVYIVGAAVVVLATAVGFLMAGTATTERYTLEAGVVEPGTGNLTLGLATGDEPIQFGVLPSEGVRSQRTVTLRNRGDAAVRIDMHVQGNISPFIRYDSGTRLAAGETRNLTLEFDPSNASIGYYRGELVVRRHRVGR